MCSIPGIRQKHACGPASQDVSSSLCRLVALWRLGLLSTRDRNNNDCRVSCFPGYGIAAASRSTTVCKRLTVFPKRGNFCASVEHFYVYIGLYRVQVLGEASSSAAPALTNQEGVAEGSPALPEFDTDGYSKDPRRSFRLKTPRQKRFPLQHCLFGEASVNVSFRSVTLSCCSGRNGVLRLGRIR